LNTASAYAIYFNKKIEETIFLAIISKILILFLAGIFFNLNVGFYSVLVLNLALLVYNIRSLIKNWKIVKNNLFTVGFWIFLLTYLFFVWLNHGRMIIIWDEFSHWALVVKNMFYLNNFGVGPESTVLARNYLSGTSLYQYFCMKLNGGFNESILYLGMNLCSFSLLIPMFKHFKSLKNFSVYLLWLIIASIPLFFYSAYYNSLYVDAILGICFAYAVYSYYFDYKNDYDKFKLINLSGALAMLIFIKDTGMIFAFIAGCIILIDSNFIKNKFQLNIKSIWKNSKPVLWTLIPCVAVKSLWIFYLKANSITSSLSQGGSLVSSFFGLFSLDGDGYKYTVLYNFVKALFSEHLFGTVVNVSFVLLLCFFIVLSYVLIMDMKNNNLKKSYTMMSTIVVFGSCGYALFLLLTYLTVFSGYEALRLASYSRYISTNALGILVMIFALLLNKYSINTKKMLKFLMISFLTMLFFFNLDTLVNMAFSSREAIASNKSVRDDYQYFKDVVEKYLDKDDYLYFISNNDNGINFYIGRYEITPIRMNRNYAWSIGSPYNDSDIWTVLKTASEWEGELKQNYNYVYLFRVDDQFISRYSELFNISANDIKDDQLYKVNKLATDNKLLELVEAK
jgi:hypothetical protein